MAQPIAPEPDDYQVAFTTAALASVSMTVNSSIEIDPPHSQAERDPTHGITGPAPPTDSEIALVETVQRESARGELGSDRDHHQGRIPANKGRRYPPEVLTPAEIAALLEACADQPVHRVAKPCAAHHAVPDRPAVQRGPRSRTQGR